MAFIEIIKYEGGNNVFVWKHPKEDFNTSAQLIVHETQEAYIYRNGQISEPYLAGKYTIQTENIPGIRRIVSLVTGGISPYHYEVYYVNKAVSMDIFWGTSWTMQDPTLQIPFRMRAHGQYSVAVENSKKMLEKLVGTTTSYTQKTLQEYFSGILTNRIKDYISNLIVSESLGYAELNTKLVSISETVYPYISDILEKYGLKLEEFVVEEIGIQEDEISEDIREAQKDRAKNVILGRTDHDNKSYDVAMTWAANSGTGGQLAQVMTGLAAGAAIGPAVGDYVENVARTTDVSGQRQSQTVRDQFSVGVIKKRQPEADAAGEIVCPGCGITLNAASHFCRNCGMNLETESILCTICGAKIPAGSKFCSVCGNKLQEG